MKILKFGGSSVGSVESIRAVLEIVKQSHGAGERPLVVLSAMAGVTNLLATLATEAAEGKDFTEGLKVMESRHFFGGETTYRRKAAKSGIHQVEDLPE